MSAKWKTTDFRGTLIYTPVTDYNAAIPKWISASLRKAVHPDPTKRYDELSEFMYDLRYPNLKLSIEDTRPLIDRNPVGFWQGLCAIFFGIIIYLLFLIKN
jgi:hypothetical protein